MSNITSASPAEAVFSGFDGVDTRRIHSGAPASADIQNFRITADGSLEKRYGYRHVFTFPSSPRAFWHGPLQDREQTYALCGSTVYAADLATGALKALGDLTTSEGEASFFFYRDSLYLIDGEQIYSIKEAGIEGEVVEDVREAVKYARSRADHQDVVYVGGSTFVVAEAL
jgi:hypothetical protein